MGTTVTYNGVTLHNVQTREWEQETVYDESNTDALYHRYRMRFEGILHAEASGSTWVGTAAQENMVAQYGAVYARLQQPRQSLKVTVSNAHAADEPLVLFECVPSVPPSHAGQGNLNEVNRDVDNGPKPLGFKILQVIGAKCLRVSFAIQCAKLSCPPPWYTGGPLQVPLVLNNRWSVSEEMDANNFTTRTIAGRMRLSCGVTSDQLVTNNPAMPQVFARYLVVPGIEEGFKRERIEFSADKSGLECEYRITDRQIHTAPPWPATRMEARHTQTTHDGFSVASEVHVRLEGPPHVDKRYLITRAIQIIDAKLNFIDRQANVSWVPELISITDQIGETNTVEAIARIRETINAPDAMLFATLRKNLGNPLELPSIQNEPHEYDPTRTDPPAVFGYVPHKGERRPTVLLTLQCYLQMPCRDLHRIFSGTQPADDEDEEESRNTYAPEVKEASSSGDLPPAKDGAWSDEHREAQYCFARISTRYLANTCRVQLPIAYSDDDDADPRTDTSKVFRIGKTQARREIQYDAERIGQWPQLPPPVDSYEDCEEGQEGHPDNLKGRLLRHWVEPHPPTLAADGVTRIYRTTAYYLYALNRPPTLEESVRVGVAPQTNLAKNDDAAKFDPAEAFDANLGP